MTQGHDEGSKVKARPHPRPVVHNKSTVLVLKQLLIHWKTVMPSHHRDQPSPHAFIFMNAVTSLYSLLAQSDFILKNISKKTHFCRTAVCVCVCVCVCLPLRGLRESTRKLLEIFVHQQMFPKIIKVYP